MIDTDSAKDSAMKLIELGIWSIGNLTTIADKADPDIQNEGTYNLVFPYMHKDFPTRDEVFNFVSDTFSMHDNTNMHNGTGSTPGDTIVFPIIPDMLEMINDDGILVKADSEVNAIGYGI